MLMCGYRGRDTLCCIFMMQVNINRPVAILINKMMELLGGEGEMKVDFNLSSFLFSSFH